MGILNVVQIYFLSETAAGPFKNVQDFSNKHL